MSCQATEVQPPDYETIYNNTPSPVHMLDVPLTTVLHNVNVPPPAYEETPAWNVPSVAPQWSMAAPMPPNPNSTSPYTRTFLKGYPKTLGIFIILVAVSEVGLGIGLPFTAPTITFPTGILYWGPLFYIVAGALTIAAQGNPSIRLIRGSLALNIISAIFSVTALTLNAVDLGILDCCYGGSSGSLFDYQAPVQVENYNNDNSDNYDNNNNNENNVHSNLIINNNWHSDDSQEHYHHHDKRAAGDNPDLSAQQQMAAAYGILSVLLVLNFVLAIVTLSAAIAGCRSLSRVKSKPPQVFLKQNNPMMSMDPVALPAYEPPQSPPPYTATEVKAVPINF